MMSKLVETQKQALIDAASLDEASKKKIAKLEQHISKLSAKVETVEDEHDIIKALRYRLPYRIEKKIKCN
jgi:phage shock protein A